MKKLVVVTHPQIENSLINSRWISELQKYPDQFTVHELYDKYPDGIINVEDEQKLVEAHDIIIFQYPLYWFNCPPLLKQWLDEVLLHGWAYGSTGNKMQGKKIALAITAGIKESDYRIDGLYAGTIKQLCLPFQMTAQYIGAELVDIFCWYDVEHQPTAEVIEDSAKSYIKFALSLS